jgi:hypothetical protein
MVSRVKPGDIVNCCGRESERLRCATVAGFYAVHIRKEDKDFFLKSGDGTFYKRIRKPYALPPFIRPFVSKIASGKIKSTYEYYGNFPLINFGSFNIKNGIPIISWPICSPLRLGMLQ